MNNLASTPHHQPDPTHVVRVFLVRLVDDPDYWKLDPSYRAQNRILTVASRHESRLAGLESTSRDLQHQLNRLLTLFGDRHANFERQRLEQGGPDFVLEIKLRRSGYTILFAESRVHEEALAMGNRQKSGDTPAIAQEEPVLKSVVASPTPPRRRLG